MCWTFSVSEDPRRASQPSGLKMVSVKHRSVSLQRTTKPMNTRCSIRFHKIRWEHSLSSCTPAKEARNDLWGFCFKHSCINESVFLLICVFCFVTFYSTTFIVRWRHGRVRGSVQLVCRLHTDLAADTLSLEWTCWDSTLLLCNQRTRMFARLTEVCNLVWKTLRFSFLLKGPSKCTLFMK